MGLGLKLSMGVELKIRREDSMTHSALLKSYDWLVESSDHQNALREIAEVADEKDIEKYRDIVDFAFCEIFPRMRPACFRFYEDRELPLREMYSKDHLNNFDTILLNILEKFYARYQENRIKSWKDIKHTRNGVADGIYKHRPDLTSYPPEIKAIYKCKNCGEEFIEPSEKTSEYEKKYLEFKMLYENHNCSSKS